MLERIVVVGGSLAGLRAVESLRTGGYDRELIVVGSETHRPYDRPPLSKKLLAGEWEPDRIELRKPDDLDSLGVTWRLGAPATGLDVDARRLTVADGTEIAFDAIVIATGSAPRRLPGQADWPHVVELRTLDDALDLRARLRDGDGPRRGDRRRLHRARGARRRRAGWATRSIVLEGAPAPLIRGLGAEMGAGVRGRCMPTTTWRSVAASRSIRSTPEACVLGDGEHVPARRDRRRHRGRTGDRLARRQRPRDP